MDKRVFWAVLWGTFCGVTVPGPFLGLKVYLWQPVSTDLAAFLPVALLIAGGVGYAVFDLVRRNWVRAGEAGADHH